MLPLVAGVVARDGIEVCVGTRAVVEGGGRIEIRELQLEASPRPNTFPADGIRSGRRCRPGRGRVAQTSAQRRDVGKPADRTLPGITRHRTADRRGPRRRRTDRPGRNSASMPVSLARAVAAATAGPEKSSPVTRRPDGPTTACRDRSDTGDAAGSGRPHRRARPISKLSDGQPLGS